MKRYNIIMLVDAAGENILMCHRMRPPYQGLYNLVGGKARQGEDGLHAAYRELREETGVTAAEVSLHHLATFVYPSGGAGLSPYQLEAYVGRMQQEVAVSGEENPLLWMPLTENFFDLTKYAGDGSIGHVVESVRRYHSDMIEPWREKITLAPLTEGELSILAYYQGCEAAELRPMLADTALKSHQGRYFEQFSVRVNGCTVGTASLLEQETDTVSDGIEIFSVFRKCGFASDALARLIETARDRGYARMTAQVRTDNKASQALHRKLGFAAGLPWINRKGNEVITYVKEL